MTGFVGRFCAGEGGGEGKERWQKSKNLGPGGGKYAKAAHAERSPKSQAALGGIGKGLSVAASGAAALALVRAAPASKPISHPITLARRVSVYSHYQTAITAVG